jgi:hypothetical protein
MFLAPENRDAVSGDLLEEYREVIVAERGQRAADRWYATQVLGYVLRSNFVWAALFSGAFIARQAYDAFVPTTDFHARAEVTSYTAISLLLAAGFWAAWRSGSMWSGVLAGIVTTMIAALISVAGCALLLAVWHDPGTMAMLRNSGGVEEMFVLPFFAIALGLILGTIGGTAGATARQVKRITFS